jgi:hypothetical protein
LKADCDQSIFPIAIEVVDCGLEASELENLAVARVSASQNLIRPGEQVELVADIVNSGDLETEKTSVEWLLEGKAVNTTPVGALAGRAKTQATATVRLADAGIFAVTCRIVGGDQVPLDQENSLIVEVADQIPVLFVEGNSAAKSPVAASELFAAALGFKNNEPQAWHSVFRPEVIAMATLAAQPLGDYRAIVINNLGEIDAATRDRLDSFVRAGGGLWIALGESVDRTWFNRDWYSDGDGLSPLGLESLEVIATQGDVAATVHPPPRDHLATLQLANTTQLDIDEARIRERWIFAQRPAADSAVSALLESGNGQPLAVENYVGQGRVLVQAFSLGLEWSNLPQLKAYVVMIHDWLSYVTAPTMARYNLSPGAPIIAAPPSDSGGVSAALVTPRGGEISLVAVDGDDSPAFRFSQTQLPGHYRIRFSSNGSPAGEVPFHIAYDATESIVEPLADAARDQLFATAGIQFSGQAAQTVAISDSAPRREPFWGILLTALVALLLGELLMSTWLARQRSGLTVSTT